MSQRDFNAIHVALPQETAKSLLCVAGFEISTVYELTNDYWPDNGNFCDIRDRNPWFLIKTQHGFIKIGSRKRVISISWEETPYRGSVTEDDVTKTQTLVHAWSNAKAVEYLSSLKNQLDAQARAAQ